MRACRRLAGMCVLGRFTSALLPALSRSKGASQRAPAAARSRRWHCSGARFIAESGRCTTVTKTAPLDTYNRSSWIALGPGAEHPVFDYCDDAGIRAAADAFIDVGLYAAGYRHFHLDDCT